ncbi:MULTISPECIES: hypothetical protein [Rhodomicrobium]|uniref:hypothetical protein n=1 Tax=Rhodomicrobium TaxID=1068 RepID=UPI000B4B153F|nr:MULTISPECIES: hypothetical protein [Rhodomicrobium]
MQRFNQVGPWTHFTVEGVSRPFYIIRFDASGQCISPQTREHMLRDLAAGDYTDVLLFSHGWNNDWEDATGAYQRFVTGFHAFTGAQGRGLPASYKPLFVGVFWPSVSLVLPWEQAPNIASAPGLEDAAADPELAAIAELLGEPERARFLALAGQTARLDTAQARELAGLFVQILNPLDDISLQPQPKLTADELLTVWRAAPPLSSPAAAGTGKADPAPDGAGMVGTHPPAAGPGAQAASFLDSLDPRWLVRLATVRIMKDRAGVVGANGVASLLQDLVAAKPARVRGIAHSYGAKLLLTALVRAELTRRLQSVLLLQPAVSYLSFAPDAGQGRSGGFRPVLAKIDQPILSTFSRADTPLYRIYHHAVRRAADIGEMQIASDGVPSRYAALGGYGPAPLRGGESLLQPLPDPGAAYPAPGPALRIVGLDGSAGIHGHGDVANGHTFWALLNQLRASDPGGAPASN